MSKVRITRIGGPTALIEIDGWRLLTDPTFDPPGRRYSFGYGTGSRKTEGPAIAESELGEVDAVLLSHDGHADNLDDAGRQLLPSVPVVLTTPGARKRLAAPNVRGLAPWATTLLSAPGRPTIEITATPGRHGPPLSKALVGEVTGFALRREGEEQTAVWVSGDTVMYEGLREVARRLSVDVAVIHIGGVRFPTTGPIRYTMTGSDAVELIGLLQPRVAVPVHYEGWSHFLEGESQIGAALQEATEAVRSRVLWLAAGKPTAT